MARFVKNIPVVAHGTGVTSVATGASSITTGQAIIVVVFNANQNNTITSVTDTAGNSYTSVPKMSSATGMIQFWYKMNATGNASNVITANFASGFNGGISAYVYSEVAANATVDRTKSNGTLGTNPTTGATTLVTQNPDEIVVGALISLDTTLANISAGTGYSGYSEALATTVSLAVEQKIVSTTGTQTATFTDSTSAQYLAALATFTDQGIGIPTATTQGATDVTLNAATLNGNITSGGSFAVTERGFVYSRRANPKIGDVGATKIIVSGTTGAMTANITGLLEDTRYQVRSYATNSAGTSYGAVTTFITETVSDYLLEGVIPTVYYFDGSDGVSDPNNAWNFDASAYDNTSGTFATIDLDGSTSTNFLQIDGTNAPTTGTTISSVRARVYGSDSDDNSGTTVINAAVYTDGLAQLLGTATLPVTAGYNDRSGAWTTLTTPTGGWTWQKVSDLEVKAYKSGATAKQGHLRLIEIEVYTTATSTDEYQLEDGSGVYSLDYTYRLPKQYYADMKTPIPVGASYAAGAANGVWLQFDARHGNDKNTLTDESNYVIPRVEIEPLGTAFTNTPTRVEEPIWTNTDEPIGFRAGVFVYDTIRDRFIMALGSNGSTSYNEVWELRLTPKGKWRKLTPIGTPPTGRYQGGGVFDAKNNRVITVFGYTTVDTNEIWELSFLNDENGTWTNRTSGITGTAPTARSNVYQSVANDPANNVLYVFGGWGAAYYNAVFKLDYNTTAMAWTNPGANGAAGAPGIRRNSGAVYDAVGNQLFVWGGAVSGTTFDTALYKFNLANNTWSTQATTGGPPAGRELHAMWFEPNLRKFYVYGGWRGTSATMEQNLWEFDVATNVWTDKSDPVGYKPLGTYGTVPAYHPDTKLTVLWSGVDTTNDLQHHVLLHDATDNPQTLYGLQMNHAPRPMDAVISRSNRDYSEALLVGGFSQMPDNTTIANGGHTTDIFEFDYAQNFFRQAATGLKTFQHREGSMLTYDTVRDRYLMFGGLWGNGGTNPGQGCFNDLWEFKKNSNGDYDVKRLNPTGTKPGTRWLGAACFDETLNRMIITLGNDGGGANYNDVWECSFASSADGVWTQRTPTGTAPSGRWGVGHGYDVNNRTLYLAGGCTTAQEGTYTNTLFKLDYSTTNCAWTTLATFPNARRTCSLVVDTYNNKAVLFGGWDNSTLYGDMYYYDIESNTWSADVNITGEPSARRSHGSWFDFENNKIMITHGRPASGGTWFGETYALTPDYNTPANSVWDNRKPVWYIRAGTLSRGTAAGVYYFNGTITDAQATWTNDANATDGNTATSATAGGTQTITSGTLVIAGTNAPVTGNPIASVKARVYGGGDSARGWGEWIQLKVPAGGWTWAKVDALESRAYATLDASSVQVLNVAITTAANAEILGIMRPGYVGSGTATGVHISRVEVEVNTTYATNTPYHWQFWTDNWSPESYGANAETSPDFWLGTSYPKIETFTADFTSNTLPANMVDGTGGNLSFAGGKAIITGGTTSTYRTLSATDTYSLLDSYFYGEVTPGNMAQASRQTFLYAEIDQNNKVQWQFSNGQLMAQKVVGGVETTIGGALTYNATNHKWVRIRESGGVTYYDYSADGITWTNHTSETNSIALYALEFGVMLGNWATESAGTTATFDNLNVVGSGGGGPTTGYKKIHNGTAWVAKPAKIHNGSTWVAGKTKIHNGTAWVESQNS